MRVFTAIALVSALVAPARAQISDDQVGSAAAAVAAESAIVASEERSEAAASEAAEGEPAAEAEETDGLALADLVSLAAGHPMVGIARAELDAYRAKLRQAHWAPWSNFSANAMFTFIPPQRLPGTYEEWTEVDDDPQWSAAITDWGPFVRVGVSGVFPLWTFGKFSNLEAMAEAGVEAGEGGVERARDQVVWEVRRAYLTLLLARDVLYLIEDGRGYIDDAREEVRERIDSGEGGGSHIDLYKIDAMVAEVDARELQARRLEEVALAGLRLLAGLGEDDVIADAPIAPFAVRRRSVDEYVQIATRKRPDLRMLEAGIRAQEAKVALERARYYPDLGLGVSVGYAYSNVADDQHVPFLNDPYNYATYGAALLVDYPLDFGMDYGRVEEAEANLSRMREQREAAIQGVEIEVTQAFAAMEDAEGRIRAYETGRRAARRWVVAVLQGMTLGLHEASDLTDGLVAYFQNEANYFAAVWDYDMALAQLAMTTGEDILEGLEPSE